MRTLLVLLMSLSFACSGSEAPRVNLDVRATQAAGSTTDLGYAISLSGVRIAMRDLEFSTAGEAHAGLLQRASNLLLATAHAHPGHTEGGAVTGELPGPLLATFGGGASELGEATLLVGPYTGLSFTFRSANAEDGLSGEDPLLGHTAHLEGTTTKEGTTLAFSAVVDLTEGLRLEGAPVDFEVSEGKGTVLELALRSGGTGAGATLFDLIDFAALATDGKVSIEAGDDASRVLSRSLQSHAFYVMNALTPEES